MDLDRKFRWYRIKLGPPKSKKYYYFRGLTANELRIAGTKPSKFEAENYILDTCVQNIKRPVIEEFGGVASKLLMEIYRVSGLDETGETFQEAVSWMMSPEGRVEAIAVSMIPSLTLQELRNCDPHDYAKYLLLAKFQFENTTGMTVEEAFGVNANGITETPESPVGFGQMIPPEPVNVSPTNPSTRVVEGGFTWRRGQ